MKKLLLILTLLVPSNTYALPILLDGQYTFHGTLAVDSALTPFFPRLDNGAYYVGLLEVGEVTALNIKTGEYNFSLSGLEFVDEWETKKGTISGPEDMHTTILRDFYFDSSKAFTMGEFELELLYKPFPIPMVGHINGTVSPFTPIQQTVPEYQSTFLFLCVGLIFILYKRYGTYS